MGKFKINYKAICKKNGVSAVKQLDILKRALTERPFAAYLRLLSNEYGIFRDAGIADTNKLFCLKNEGELTFIVESIIQKKEISPGFRKDGQFYKI